MVSNVYFSGMRASYRRNALSKIQELLDRVSIESRIKPRDLVAIKTHFGEKGNTAFIRPLYFRGIVERVKNLGAKPFLTDSNTLYIGTRSDSISHLDTAIENGFSYATVGAPIIIADGIRGGCHRDVPIRGECLSSVSISADIADADAMISVAHFKGHELTGFAATLKNLGMGCASRKGKLEQHSSLSPKVKSKKCLGCGECTRFCSQGAISLIKGKSFINPQVCVGCAECVIICPQQAIKVQWNEPSDTFQKKMVEYAMGALARKRHKAIFFNFLIQISPNCDCAPYADAPVVRDIGVLISDDPVAIDQASVDMVNQAIPNAGSCLGASLQADKFRALYPEIDWSIQLDHAQKIGLGVRNYQLTSIDGLAC